MKFEKEPMETYYLGDTALENMFICEYMPDAPGDYVKVYLTALMYANIEKNIELEQMAKLLMISTEEIKKAFLYWKEAGIVSVKGEKIEILSLKEKLYGKKKEVKRGIIDDHSRKLLENQGIKDMYKKIERELGKFLTLPETNEIMSWIVDFGATPEVISSAYEYCNKKKKSNHKYVATVVKDWVSRGMATKEDIEKFLDETDQRHYIYNRVMKALGFHRNATEEEKRIIDNWQDSFGYKIDDILTACNKTSGISNPNINYVNKVLTSKKSKNGSRTPGKSVVSAYYEHLRNKADSLARKKKEDVYAAIPEIKDIDDKIVECSMSLTKVMINGGVDKVQQIEAIKKQGEDLEKRRIRILTEKNIPIDYMNTKYECNICKDTGIKDTGEQCECYIKRAQEAAEWKR